MYETYSIELKRFPHFSDGSCRFAGMYGSLPYALAQGDVEIPYLILQSVLYSVITYWLIR